MTTFAAIIEISPAVDGTLPAELIARAYRAATQTPILLVLDGTTPAAVDRLLDADVRVAGRAIATHAGVRYARLGDVVHDGLPEAHLVVGDREDFIVLALRAGIPLTPTSEAVAALTRPLARERGFATV